MPKVQPTPEVSASSGAEQSSPSPSTSQASQVLQVSQDATPSEHGAPLETIPEEIHEIEKRDALQACLVKYDETLQKVRESVLKHAQEVKKATPGYEEDEREEQIYRKLKPLFKEWLEIRCDFHSARGDARKLPDKDVDRLTKRVITLLGYLAPVEEMARTDRVDHLKKFIKWLKKQVTKTGEAIQWAKAKEQNGSQANNPDASAQVTDLVPPAQNT